MLNYRVNNTRKNFLGHTVKKFPSSLTHLTINAETALLENLPNSITHLTINKLEIYIDKYPDSLTHLSHPTKYIGTPTLKYPDSLIFLTKGHKKRFHCYSDILNDCILECIWKKYFFYK